jgi:NADPH:quinone reductase-like Zn-dependent oxidoreductase
VLTRNRAFGLNRAELYMRDGSPGDLAAVPGIECAGRVETDPSDQLAPGTPVVAIMRGPGRTRNGSYAELAAVPEVYVAAWSGLHDNLALQPGQTLLVRGQPRRSARPRSTSRPSWGPASWPPPGTPPAPGSCTRSARLRC